MRLHCRHCKDEFEPAVHNQRFCSYSCRRKHHEELQRQKRGMRDDGFCDNCGHKRAIHVGGRGACSSLGDCGCSHYRFKRVPQGKTLMQLYEEGKL